MKSQNNFFSNIIAVAVCLIVAFAATSKSMCQIRIEHNIQVGGEIRGEVNLPGQVFVARNAGQTTVAEGLATLKTDPDLESILEQANRYREDEQYDVAAKLWQAVLERSGDALFTEDDQTYFSLVQQVERIIADLPPEGGLDTYRVTADASAIEILAAADDPYDVVALSKIVRRYFLSSHGDDAALSLSALYMDEFDFVGAYRLLRKIVDLYPDPSVSMREVHSRIALCQSYFGQLKDAKTSIDAAMKIADPGAEQITKLVAGSFGKIAENRGVVKAADDVQMALGSAARYGVMPTLPRNAFAKEMIPQWQYFYHFQRSYKWTDIRGITPLMGRDAIDEADDTRESPEKKVIEDWLEKKWRPAGHLVVAGEQLFFKTPLDSTVWNLNAKAKSPTWRSVWENRFQIDEYTSAIINSRSRRSRTEKNRSFPTTTETVQAFSDRIAGQMSVQDGIYYSIEGKRVEPSESSPGGIVRNQRNRRNHWNVQPRRARSNYLTAYDARTGKVKWTLPASIEQGQEEMPAADDPDEEQPWLLAGGFMAAPVHFNGLAIVPVNNGGAISIYALDPNQNGKTIWKSFLCDEPESGANPFSPINLSLDGSDLFVSCGLGLVFVMDPSTGLVRFAKRYQRHGQPNKILRQYGRNAAKMTFDEWGSDTIVPYGRQMICFSSDSKFIDSLDRKDGSLIWRSEINALGYKLDYLLGIYDDILYAGGQQTLVAFDLKGEGRMKWGGDQLFDDEFSYGRGMLTADGIFVPAGNKILKFDLNGEKNKPKLLGTANVDLGTGAPVGNLYSDGEKIWVHGANRLYALKPGKPTKTEPKTTKKK